MLAADSSVYSKYYPNTIVTSCHSIKKFLAVIATGCDIVHLLGEVSASGIIADKSGDSLSGRSLIHHCCAANVKLLWMASNVNSKACVIGFDIERQPINLVLTNDRRGTSFSSFLEQLLSRLSAGITMPHAWVQISPQTTNAPQQSTLPVSIFVAGLGGAVFR
jgi:hypothetical protein